MVKKTIAAIALFVAFGWTFCLKANATYTYQHAFQQALTESGTWSVEPTSVSLREQSWKLINEVYKDVGHSSRYDYTNFLVRKVNKKIVFSVGLIETEYGYYFHKVGYSNLRIGMASFKDLFQLIKETDGWFMQNRNYMMTLITKLFRKSNLSLLPAPLGLVQQINHSIVVPKQPYRKYRVRQLDTAEIDSFTENKDIQLDDFPELLPYVYFIEKSDTLGAFSGNGKAKILNGRPLPEPSAIIPDLAKEPRPQANY